MESLVDIGALIERNSETRGVVALGSTREGWGDREGTQTVAHGAALSSRMPPP